MVPDIETFRNIVNECKGNLSVAAKRMGVTRTTLANWRNTSPEYAQAVEDARMRLFDSCLVSAEVLALGEYIKDDDGKIQWVRLPDGNMLRYLMSHLGRNEGFSDAPAKEEEAASRNAEDFTDISIEVTYNEKEHLELQGKRDVPSDDTADKDVEVLQGREEA